MAELSLAERTADPQQANLQNRAKVVADKLLAEPQLNDQLELIGSTAVQRLTASEMLFGAPELKRATEKLLQKQDFIKDQPEEVRAAVASLMAARMTEERLSDPRHFAAFQDQEFGTVRFTTAELAGLEKQCLADARAMGQSEGFGMAEAQIQHVSNSFVQGTEKAGFPVDWEHVAALEEMLRPGQLKVLDGPAGAGKTHLVKAMIKGVKNHDPDAEFIVTAPGDRAAADFHKDTGQPGATLDTINRWLEEGKVKEGATILVDESGMADVRQTAKLLTQAREQGIKVVLMGESNQCPPSGPGEPHRLFTSQDEVPVIRITDIKRQKKALDRKAAMDIRAGKPQACLDSYDERGALQFESDRESVMKAAARDYVAFKGQAETAGKSVLVVTPDQESADRANMEIRAHMREAGQLTGGATLNTTGGDKEFAAGDRIRFEQGFDLESEGGHLERVLPGTAAQVVRAENGAIGIKIEGKEDIYILNQKDKPPIDYAHAVSVRSSQGMSVDRVIGAIDKPMDKAEAYVMMTRHKDEFTARIDRSVYSSTAEMAKDFSVRLDKSMGSDMDRLPGSQKGQAALVHRLLAKGR